MRVPLPLPLGSYQSDSPTQSIRRVINWIPVTSQSEALNNKSLLQPPGISQVIDTGLGACRGGHVVAGVRCFVNGNSLVSLNSGDALTNHGAIAGSVRVQMADNGSILVIVVPGGNAYTFDASSSVLTQITDPDFQVSDSVQFYRGFFVFTTTDGKQLFVSNLNQPLVFDALDFGSAEGDPDRIVTQIVDHDELSILGSETTEVFKNVGGVDFPLQIISGAFTQKGAHSKYGAIKFDNTYLFIGGGENELTSIWRQASSSQAVKLSDDTIDGQIQKFTKEEIAQAFTMSFSKKGQFFAIFSFNSSRIPGRTFVYNGTASAYAQSPVWFELQTGLTDAPWRVNAVIKANGKLYVGDSIDGRIGVLDDSVLTEYGETIMRQAAFQPFSQDGNTLFAGELEATFQSGVGLTLGQGSDPQVIYDFTDNNQVWSNEFKRSIGAIGEYGHETVWHRQGRFPNSRTIRFTVTEPVVANLIRVAATPEAGND
tara:strand:+ start:759 stop:2210 length:1452 start_codon:yes stop_codon:yes gene_type:complete